MTRQHHLIRRLPMLAVMALGLACSLTFAATEASDTEPLRGEDIVRLHVGGSGADELIALIRKSNVDFDLSDEMVEEFGFAGLSPRVIQAMRDRTAELELARRKAAGIPDEPDPDALPTMILMLVAADQTDDEGRLTMTVDAAPNPSLTAAFGLDPESSELENVALFVVCTTQDHVPDHWRGNSPLGRDFISMPRHKLLHFQPGTRATDERGDALLSLEISSQIEIELRPEIPHDLAIGIALQIDGRYYRLTDTVALELTLPPTGMALIAELSSSPGHSPTSIAVRLK